METKRIEQLQNFLICNFNQDIISFENTIDEILTDEDIKYIEFVVKLIIEFLESSLTLEDKVDFIKNNTAIHFNDIDLEPITWICEVKDMLSNAI